MKFTIAALLVASTSAVTLKDDCDGKWCNKGLAYDFDEPTRDKAHADMVAKTQAFNGATKAHNEAAAAQAAANAKDLIEARKQRDLDAATAAKNAADANLAANEARVAYEKDQLERGQNQDRLKHVNENTSAKTSEILGKHDERERANGRLLKALASF